MNILKELFCMYYCMDYEFYWILLMVYIHIANVARRNVYRFIFNLFNINHIYALLHVFNVKFTPELYSNCDERYLIRRLVKA